MIIDVHTHCHTRANNPASLPMFDPERYVGSMGETDMAIIIGMKFRATGTIIPNDNIPEVMAQYPGKFAGFCSVHPDDHDAVEDLEHSVRELGLIGLKLSPIYQGFYPHEPKYYPIYRKAIELGAPVAFHTNASMVSPHSRHLYGDLRYLDQVALEFPELKIIICHLGYTDYHGAIDLVKKHPNVYTDCSYVCHLAGFDTWIDDFRGTPRPTVHYPYYHWIEPFLYNFSTPGDPDKILFGSDYPGATAEITLKALRDLPEMMRAMNLPPIPQEKIDNVIQENWKRLFKLDGKGRLVPADW